MANDDIDILPDLVRGAASDAERRVVAAAIAIPAHVVQAKGHGHAGTAMAATGSSSPPATRACCSTRSCT